MGLSYLASTVQSANGEFVINGLPGGLSYNISTGTISGTVAASTAPGRYRGYKFGATDGRSKPVVSDEFIINVQ